ncbi:YcgL domain-containing protein [Sulfurivermis fontis]|uniref:YcgL domain-containing protein n=1 Tax=Sulfurivermis fontis TaxID=1972068 RepID=UPI000FD9CFB3|nr:YcgL domain-containing protein [Sulfurivermis fontis]
MKCFIYKSSKKDQLYLYLPRQDDFKDVPPILMDTMGQPVFVMELELNPERKLARANVAEVLAGLADRGFYLQMPPKDPLADMRVGS